jgi:penicillin-binding protein 2
MKLYDHTQNLSVRVSTIQIIAFVLLTILGVRLYYLQISKGEYYADKAENQRIRKFRFLLRAGDLRPQRQNSGRFAPDLQCHRLERSQKTALRRFRQTEIAERIDDYARGLNVERQYVLERLNYIKSQREFDSLVLKDNASIQDITWVEAHSMEYPELRIELQPQRFYPHKEILAHVLATSARSARNSLKWLNTKKKVFVRAILSARAAWNSITMSFYAVAPAIAK